MRSYTSAIPYTEKPVLAYGVTRAPITQIILHSTAGTVQSAINWFNNPAAGTSSHYIIGNDGKLYAMLEEYLTAYHAGNLAVNQRSIGIEHEGYPGLVRSPAEYATSVKLVADICKYYDIPCDRNNIKSHKEIVSTSCPTDLDVDRIVRDAKALLTPVTPPTPSLNWTEDQKKKVVALVQQGSGAIEKWKIREILKITYIP